MALILHLSDLHLGARAAGEVLGDHKVEVIPPGERLRRTTLIRSTLRELGGALASSGRCLDALVISGDVTYACDPRGFELLEPTLEELGAALPPRNRVLVVPGNHDVTWYTRASSGDRYQAFIEGVRDKGYITPYLEGVDILPDGSLRQDAPQPVVTADDGSFVIVGLNSANHCGVEVPVDGDLEEYLAELRQRGDADPAAAAVLRAWQARGRFDVPRVDPSQRRYASDALRQAVARALTGTIPPLRIAVMHHQLLPVSLDEEVKPFESLTNLAEVRDWLAGNKVDLLMHGHKHVGRLYEDRFRPEHTGRNEGLCRVLVSATATVGLGRGRGGEVAKLFDLDASLPTLGRLRVTSVPAIDSGIPLDLTLLTSEERNTRSDWMPASGLIEGQSNREVHEQLVALFDSTHEPPASPVVCRILDGSSAASLPASYPSLDDAGASEAWLKETVELWQAPKKLGSMPFNHGERILNLEGIDQLAAAIRCLDADATSSRAVITLLDPRRDRVEDKDVEFPAFCLVHFTVTSGRLNVVGYFRKQEMLYWWPINTAELARLQAHVLSGLSRRGKSLNLGQIVTVTALPIVGQSVPRVAIPQMDVWLDQQPDRLMRMALLAYDPALPEARAILEDWRLLVRECRPREAEAADGNPSPIAGLRAIIGHLHTIGPAHGKVPRADKLLDALELMVSSNETYLAAARGVPGRSNPGVEGSARAFERLSEAVKEMEAEVPAVGDMDSAIEQR